MVYDIDFYIASKLGQLIQQKEFGQQLKERLQGTEFELEEQAVIRILSQADNKKVLYANIKDIEAS